MTLYWVIPELHAQFGLKVLEKIIKMQKNHDAITIAQLNVLYKQQ